MKTTTGTKTRATALAGVFMCVSVMAAKAMPEPTCGFQDAASNSEEVAQSISTESQVNGTISEISEGEWVLIEGEGYKKKTSENAYKHSVYLKSNLPAWVMLWANAAIEVDLAPHWSLSMPIYYSGWNYFSSRVKFRTFTFIPEARWWVKGDNMGLFVNAHLGVGSYNYADKGEYRYQDKNGNTPALGGGLGIGYRFECCSCKSKNWTIEVEIGAGAYRLSYDRFLNYPNGPLIDSKKRTFFGIDQASLSFCYRFGNGKNMHQTGNSR